MGQKFVNNLAVKLVGDISNVAVNITVDTTVGFPVLALGDWFYLTITDKREGGEIRWEIVKVNAVTGNTLSVVRGQDGTTAQNWLDGSDLTLRVVAQDMNELEAFKDSKNQPNGIAPLDSGSKVPVTNLPDYITPSTQTQLDNRVKTVVNTTNAVHVIRKDNWVWNFDNAVTGALRFNITGLYSRTLSGGMSVLITQNSTSDGTYPDYEFYVSGNWRTSGTTWHNTEARVCTVANEVNNVRFAHDGVDCYILIGDTNKVWNFPRIVIKDLITNTVAAGYTPDLEVALVTSLPSTVQSVIAVKGLGQISDFTSALTTALV